MTETARVKTEQPYVMSLRQRRLGLIAIAVVLVLVGVGVWLLRAHQTFSDVAVTPKSLRCDGKDIPSKIVEDEFEDGPPRLAFKTRIEVKTECWLTVVVANSGSRSVHLDSMTFPAMMPGESGRFLLVTPRTIEGTKPHEVDESGDAIFDADQTIAPESWIELTYELRYRPDGATCMKVQSESSGFPVAHVKATGLSANIVGSVDVIHPSVRTTGNRNC